MTSPPKSRLITTAYVLILTGIGIAVVDIITDTYFLWKAIVVSNTHAGTSIYVLIWLRVLCYIGLVPLTIVLERRVRIHGSRSARAGLVGMMCGYAVGNVANFLISEGVFVMVMMLKLLQDSDIGAWLTNVWTVSAVSDALGLVLALTIAVLLLCVKLEHAHSAQPSTIDSGGCTQ